MSESQAEHAHISVIVPTYNSARYVTEALDGALAQTIQPFEIIVVDDGSTDDSRDVVSGVAARARDLVRTLHRSHGGTAFARNTGIAAAHGNLLAFLDADDVWPSDRTERLLAPLLADPTLEASFGAMRQFVSPELTDEQRARLSDDGKIVCADTVTTMLIRTAAFHRVGLFNEGIGIGESVDWSARAEEAALRRQSLDHVVLLRRLHLTNATRRQRNSTDYVRAVRGVLGRRRQTTAS